MKKLISRRNFFSVGLAAFIAPLVDHDTLTLTVVQAATHDLPEEIRAREAQLRAHPDRFSWAVHNELRHLYGDINEHESRRHADIILQHTVMDDYILNTLSDWHFTDHYHYDPDAGVTVLLDTAARYRDLPHLWAACYLRAAQGRMSQGKADIARVLLDRLLRDMRLHTIPTLEPYRAMAERYRDALDRAGY